MLVGSPPCTMFSILQELNKETFIFDVEQVLDSAPSLAGYNTRLIDAHSFEVDMKKGQALNQVFALLDAQNVHITSMRNKSNRLEEMFVAMTGINEPEVSVEALS